MVQRANRFTVDVRLSDLPLIIWPLMSVGVSKLVVRTLHGPLNSFVLLHN